MVYNQDAFRILPLTAEGRETKKLILGQCLLHSANLEIDFAVPCHYLISRGI